VKAIAEAHGGELICQALGYGTVATIWILTYDAHTKAA
jgi:hypothetical protein